MLNNQKLIALQEIPDNYVPVKLATLRSWVFSGKLPVVRLGRKVYVKEAVLNLLLDQGLEAVQNEYC